MFGPGVGECIVAHLGNNQWIIVDSCLEYPTRRPSPLLYLESLGIKASEAVKLFVITHWHSDHIQGASEVAAQCKNATICFSEVFLKEDFLALVAAYSGLEDPVLVDRETSGTKEIASVIQLIKKRYEKFKESSSSNEPLDTASANQVLFRALSNEIWALSPSSKSVIEGWNEIATLLEALPTEKVRRVIPAPHKNHNSVALLLKMEGIFDVLLGSDLEETRDLFTGWSAIVNSKKRPDSKAKIFKIPHHGSQNGHNHEVWKQMVSTNPIGVMTTKLGGQSSLPKDRDIKRLKEYTDFLCCAVEPKPKRQKRERLVEKSMKGVVKRRTPLNGEMGQIQIRAKNKDQININLKEPALRI